MAINPIGSEFLIATSAYSRGVAMDADGDFVVTWATQSGIYAQRYNVNGIAIGSEFLVNTSAYSRGVAMDADGDFIVTWGWSSGGVCPMLQRRWNSD